MTIRYGNDIVLTELARQIANYNKSMQAYLRDGHLDTAFLRALRMYRNLDKFMERLNDIKYGRV